MLKAILKQLVDVEIVEQMGGLVITHPIIQTSHLMDQETGNLFAVMDEPERAREMYRQQIEQEDNTYVLLTMMVSKPYRLTVLGMVWECLDAKEKAELLVHNWITVEFPNHDTKEELNKFIAMFKEVGTTLMEEDELEVYNEMLKADTVIVYRGYAKNDGDMYPALSWTRNLETAQWFANRWKEKGMVVEAVVKTTHVLAYIDQRNEQEVIIDPRGIVEKGAL